MVVKKLLAGWVAEFVLLHFEPVEAGIRFCCSLNSR